MNTIVAEELAIRKALTIEEIFWHDEKERALYEMRENALLDYRSELNAIREEGREENKKNTAKGALRKGYPVDDVADITALSRETVLSLKSEVEQEHLQAP